MHNLEFRGRWLDIFGNVLLIAILTTITLGIYAPWGYTRYRRMIATRTYYRDNPLQFDGTGMQAFVEFLIIGALSLITLGLYVILGFAQTRLLRWQYAHTIMPTGQRLEYRGDAIDLFFENFLLVFFSTLTLGIYYFWGHVRVQRYILTHTFLEDKPLAFEGRGVEYLGIMLLNWLLSVITLGFYAILGFATVRLLRWSVGNTLVPEPVRASRPMPVHSPTASALSGAAAAEWSRSEPMAEYPHQAEELPSQQEEAPHPGSVRAYPQEGDTPDFPEREQRYPQEDERSYPSERESPYPRGSERSYRSERERPYPPESERRYPR